jgi:Uma2 family endonuclease
MVADTPTASATAPWASLAPSPYSGRFFRAADLAMLPDDGWLYELVEGRLVRMPPPKGRHGRLESRIDNVLSAFIVPRGLGCVYVGDTGFDLTRPGETEETMLGADVAFVRAERVPLADDDDAYIPGPPDLAVEIASGSQYRPEMSAKAWVWLQRGTRMVWVVWPKRNEVDVWTPEREEPLTLRAGDDIDGGEVLPGFICPVAELLA